jgi:hypothetical protein
MPRRPSYGNMVAYANVNENACNGPIMAHTLQETNQLGSWISLD